MARDTATEESIESLKNADGITHVIEHDTDGMGDGIIDSLVVETEDHVGVAIHKESDGSYVVQDGYAKFSVDTPEYDVSGNEAFYDHFENASEDFHSRLKH